MVKRHHGLGRFLGFIEPRGRGGAYHHGTHRLAPSAGWVRILGNCRLDDGLDGATDGTTLLRLRRRSMRVRPSNWRPWAAFLFSRDR